MRGDCAGVAGQPLAPMGAAWGVLSHPTTTPPPPHASGAGFLRRGEMLSGCCGQRLGCQTPQRPLLPRVGAPPRHPEMPPPPPVTRRRGGRISQQTAERGSESWGWGVVLGQRPAPPQPPPPVSGETEARRCRVGGGESAACRCPQCHEDPPAAVAGPGRSLRQAAMSRWAAVPRHPGECPGLGRVRRGGARNGR